MSFNWLLGGAGYQAPQQGTPETPAHTWAMNALRFAIQPDTPVYHSRPLCESPATAANSILKTPGQAKEKKNFNVTFHKSVRTPPKKIARSGLPNQFPGKFPSPWTPTDLLLDEADINDMADSPITIEKDQHANSRFTRPLKALSSNSTRLSLQPAVQDDKRSRNSKSSRHDMNVSQQKQVPLTWDVNKGFDEVLQSVARNNAYLQDLINEMQESFSHAEESFCEFHSMNGSEATTNLDDPQSNSGKFWHAKFLDFKGLTEKLKVEQNNMEKAIDRLRKDVKHNDTRQATEWQNRCEELMKELEQERSKYKVNSCSRELRDMKRQLSESREKMRAQENLQKQLEIADLQIKDLQSQLNIKSSHTSARGTGTVSAIQAPSSPASKARSSTSDRLAQTRALAESRLSNVTFGTNMASADFKRRDKMIRSDTESGHRILNSRSRDVAIQEEHIAPMRFSKTYVRTCDSPSFSPPPPTVPAVKRPSPRPTFTSLDVNTSRAQRSELEMKSKPTMEQKRLAMVQDRAKQKIEERKLQRKRENEVSAPLTVSLKSMKTLRA